MGENVIVWGKVACIWTRLLKNGYKCMVYGKNICIIGEKITTMFKL